jgi:adenine/guanine phosphoribosyltransferase-like PRPP-binding protein
MPAPHFTEPTEGYWQAIVARPPCPLAPPFRLGYPARLPDGRFLVLPIRERPGGGRAVASLIPTQASFEVVRALADLMTDAARPLASEVVIGMPTLGLAMAPLVAERLGHPNYVALGYSEKFWYRDGLSVPIRSITSPGAKTLWLDPNLLPRLEGRRALLVDDTISTGTSAVAALDLLARTGVDIVGLVFAMRQGSAWRETLAGIDPGLPARVHGVLDTPMLVRHPQGWVPEAPGG